jgi:tRNA A-37 threonylcarbamoyl transferase component Bud32/HAMP domain-containing protein
MTETAAGKTERQPIRKLGRYEIRERIGRGAMADVYRAYDPSINRVLAIKVIKPEFRQSRQYVARFLREAKAAGALSHPNIVTIFDVGVEAGYPYIAMELLEGEPLDQLMKRGERLGMDVIVGLALQLADALNYAHGLGIVHRDVKPSNIALAKDGRSVKLLDFGIASLAEVDLAAEDAVLRTQVGQVLGTPRYMSPEQALGLEADGRSDLFSVGVVLYELITGRHAFEGANAIALALQITQTDPAPIGKLAPDCPGGLQFIVGKLLAKRPEKRFADGGQLAHALRREQGARALVPTGRRAMPLPARMALVMGAITGLVLFVSVGAVLSRQDQAMERMALTSGAAITAFIANNAAVAAAENASLPADQRDWLPVQAFVRTAADDPNVRQITIVDDAGVIRASTALTDVGRRYGAKAGEPVVSRRDGVTVSNAPDQAFRFVRPITYAGRAFGQVDVSVSRADLDAAATLSRVLLAFLALITLGAVITVSYVTARTVVLPIHRLRNALRDAARGNLDFRISHNRRDEFGELFDGFNRLAVMVQARLEAAEATPAIAMPARARPQAGPASAIAGSAEADDDSTQITAPLTEEAAAPAPPAVSLVQRLRDLKRA